MVRTKKGNALRRWELALLLGAGLALLAGTWTAGQQKALAEQVVRLHVVGASDSQQDQQLKLTVRDAVLSEAAPWLEQATSREEAMAVIAQQLPHLADVGAQAAGGDVTVTASLEEQTWFPTKQYTDFSLPAGYYPALKITLGEGAGRNWWCVVYPPLCLGSVSETVAERAETFSPGQVALITGESEGYVVKFKAMELLGQLTHALSGDAA